MVEAVSDPKFSTVEECLKAVEYVSKFPRTLTVVLLFKREEIRWLREILEPLRKDLAASQGDGQVCLLALNETQLHGIQFLETFNMNPLSMSSVSVVRYDGYLMENKKLSHPLDTAEIADMVVAAQKKVKDHLIDLFSIFLLANFEILKSSMSKSASPVLNVPKVYSADGWVCGKLRLSAVGKANILLKRMSVKATKNKKPVQSSNIRIRIRLLNGNKIVVSFKPSDTLQQIVDEIISQDAYTERNTWILATAYPRRSFTDADMDKSLSELKIELNTLIVVEPKEGYDVSTEKSTFSGFFSYFIIWVLSVWEVIRRWFQPPKELTASATADAISDNVEDALASRATMNLRRRSRNLADLKGKDQPRSNEYFGGDSTVYLGGDD